MSFSFFKWKKVERGWKEECFLFPSQKNPCPLLAPWSLHESQNCTGLSSPCTVPLWSKQEDSRARTKDNSREGGRGGKGVKKKGGEISLMSYGRVIACVELCCRVLENHLLHRKVTASKMLAWRWRYVLWPRVGLGEGFLPIVLQWDGNSMMVLYSSTTGKLDLRSPILTFLSSCFWHAKRSWEHNRFFKNQENIIVIQRGLRVEKNDMRCWKILEMVQLKVLNWHNLQLQ